MVTITNRQRKVKVNLSHLKKEAQAMLTCLGYADFDLGILLTTNASIRKLNAAYRGKDKPTDILSFSFHPDLKPGQKITPRLPEDKNLGDIVLSLEYIQKDAVKTWQRSLQDHLTALLAHGIAHLLNYDHETDAQFRVMRRVELKLLRAVGKKL